MKSSPPFIPAPPDPAPASRATTPAPLPDALPSADSGAAAVPHKRPLFPSLALLLAGHILRDGEVVILILKPSLWYILFSSMRFGAGVLIGVIAAQLWLPKPTARWYVEAGVFLLAGRVMWSILHWMGRLYVLTDRRILRLSGVFAVNLFDCPLRRVGQTRVVRSFRERLWRLGSVEIAPDDESLSPVLWRTIRHPAAVHEQVEAAVRRAKTGGPACGWD